MDGLSFEWESYESAERCIASESAHESMERKKCNGEWIENYISLKTTFATFEVA